MTMTQLREADHYTELSVHDDRATEESVTLPGGWTARRRTTRDRSHLEVRDIDNDLVGLVSSTHLPIAAVDGAWRGFDHGPDGTRNWWALAIGHARPDQPVSLTFSRLLLSKRTHRVVVTPVVVDTLWIAAIPGQFTTLTFHQGADESVRRLMAAHNFWSRSA